MRNPTPQQLFEIDRCFDYVMRRIVEDNIHPRNVLFGSTVDNWFRTSTSIGRRMKIVIGGEPPHGAYERAAWEGASKTSNNGRAALEALDEKGQP